MFDLKLHSDYALNVLSLAQGERVPRFLAHLAKNLPEAANPGALPAVPAERAYALTVGLPAAQRTCAAFLASAKASKKDSAARSPLLFELAAMMEAARDVSAALTAACREAVLSMARGQAALLKRLGPKAGRDAPKKAEAIAGAWKAFQATLASADEEVIFRAFFRATTSLLRLGATAAASARAVAPLARQVEAFVRGERSDLNLSTTLPTKTLYAACALPASADNACRAPEHPVEAKVFAAVDAAFGGPPPPTLRAFVADLAIQGHILERQATLARELREKTEEVEAARRKYKRLKAERGKQRLIKLVSLGRRRFEDYADPKALKLALNSMEEDLTALRGETELSAGRPAAYLEACVQALEASLARARQACLAEVGAAFGPARAKQAAAALDAAARGDGTCPPDAPGFWTPVLAEMALEAAENACGRLYAALAERNAKTFGAHVPAFTPEFERVRDGLGVRLATPDAGATVFQKPLSELLGALDPPRESPFHSQAEKAEAEKFLEKYRGPAKLLAAPEKSLSEELRRKRAALEKRLPAMKMELADAKERLHDVHRREMRRVSVKTINQLAEAFFGRVEAQGADADRLAKLKEILTYAKTLSSAMPGMEAGDAGETVTKLLGEELLLGLENALTQGTSLEAAEAGVRHVFDTARSLLLGLDPVLLKSLMKKSPNLSRALNFLTG